MWLFKKQTPPNQAAKSHSVSGMSADDLAESKSSASKPAASLPDDGGSSVQTSYRDMFIFRNIAFKDLWDVGTSFDFHEQPEVEVKESAITKMKNAGDSEPQVSSFRSYRWAPLTPISGIMQTIGLVPIPEEGLVGQSGLPSSQGLPERDLGLVINAWKERPWDGGPDHFRSRYLCQLNPLMLPVMDVHNGALTSDEEWKLRGLLAKRKEKLRVLIVLFQANVENVLFLLKRFSDLLSDVTTVVIGDATFCQSVYVIDLTKSENHLDTIAMLAKRIKFEHSDAESFSKTISICAARNESWHVVEATIKFDSSLHDFVFNYPKPPNIFFTSEAARSMHRIMKNNLLNLFDSSCTLIDLGDFGNLQFLICDGLFVNLLLQKSHSLQRLCWCPMRPTRFDDCAWGCLSNLLCLTIVGIELQPNLRISLQDFPKLVSFHLIRIAESGVVDFGHLPLRLNELLLSEFQGSLEGTDQLQIEKLLFRGKVCSNAYSQLCPNSEKVDIGVTDIEDTYRQVYLVADQLKCLKLNFCEGEKPTGRFFLFNILGKVFPLLESLELTLCSVMLSVIAFPCLHHLTLYACDVLFSKTGIAGQYGDSFPELMSLALFNCKLLLDETVPEDVGQEPLGVIDFQAPSLFSLKLINVSNLHMLQIHKQSFPRLQSLRCHVAKHYDFPFAFDKPGVPLFPHLRKLNLKKNALDGKKINLDLLADMGRLDKLELLDNAFFTLLDVKPIQCRWVHFSSAIVEHENARVQIPGGMPLPMESSDERMTFAEGLVSKRCEVLIVNHTAMRIAFSLA